MPVGGNQRLQGASLHAVAFLAPESERWGLGRGRLLAPWSDPAGPGTVFCFIEARRDAVLAPISCCSHVRIRGRTGGWHFGSAAYRYKCPICVSRWREIIAPATPPWPTEGLTAPDRIAPGPAGFVTGLWSLCPDSIEGQLQCLGCHTPGPVGSSCHTQPLESHLPPAVLLPASVTEKLPVMSAGACGSGSQRDGVRGAGTCRTQRQEGHCPVLSGERSPHSRPGLPLPALESSVEGRAPRAITQALGHWEQTQPVALAEPGRSWGAGDPFAGARCDMCFWERSGCHAGSGQAGSTL